MYKVRLCEWVGIDLMTLKRWEASPSDITVEQWFKIGTNEIEIRRPR